MKRTIRPHFNTSKIIFELERRCYNVKLQILISLFPEVIKNLQMPEIVKVKIGIMSPLKEMIIFQICELVF